MSRLGEMIARLCPNGDVRGTGPMLEYAVMHGGEAEAERIREELRKLTESV